MEHCLLAWGWNPVLAHSCLVVPLASQWFSAHPGGEMVQCLLPSPAAPGGWALALCPLFSSYEIAGCTILQAPPGVFPTLTSWQAVSLLRERFFRHVCDPLAPRPRRPRPAAGRAGFPTHPSCLLTAHQVLRLHSPMHLRQLLSRDSRLFAVCEKNATHQHLFFLKIKVCSLLS